MDPIKFPNLTRDILTTLQVNIGYRCNQKCAHCHVNAGPDREEMMDSATISLIPKVLENYNLKILDITGGAPEIHPQFQELIIESRKLGVEVIDRCNLTILNEPGFEYLARFLADNKVVITASMPCYEKTNVDKQRGLGVFERSIDSLKKLNKLGYGKKSTDLILNLVFNPQGTQLPPPQLKLEEAYRKELCDRYDIHFNSLYTIVNMPIKRFAMQLASSGKLKEYQELLISKYNHSNLERVMCRTLISVDWQGHLYDCDFNQQLKLKKEGKIQHLLDLLNKPQVIRGQSIKVGNHCFGCTAGSGSSCSGALKTTKE